MTDYTNTFAGTAKDTANDIILGADHDTEYDSLATHIATKLDLAGGTVTGVIDGDDATDSTSGGTGSIHTDGGIGAVKDMFTDATLHVKGDVTAGDLATLGYSSTWGAKLTGQGSLYDCTLVNDLGNAALGVRTGTVDTQHNGSLFINNGTKGISFDGATAAGGMTSQLLHNYEEGTFDITLTATSGTVTLDSSLNSLAYTRVGRLVHVQGRIQIDSVSSPTGDITFNGLPFTTSTLSEGQGRTKTVISAQAFVGSLTDEWVQLELTNGATTGSLTKANGAGASSIASNIQATTNLYFNFFYLVAS